MTLATLPFPVALRSLDATFTAEMWEQLPDDGNRYELIEGVLYVSTAPSLFHQWIAGRINAIFEQQLVISGVAYVFLAPVGVYLPGDERTQPDVVVVRREDRAILRDRRVRGVPALLIEILSPSNAEVDTGAKLTTYARAGVPEYWIVRPAERDVIVHSEPDIAAGEYRVVAQMAPEGELVSPTLPVRAVIADFFAGSPDTTL